MREAGCFSTKTRKRISTELSYREKTWQLLRKSTVSKQQNVAQRLNSNHKSITIECIENTENKRKDFSRCNVEKSLYLLIKMMDESTTFQKGWIQEKTMVGFENELFLTSLAQGQSTLTRNCVAQQVLRNWLGTLSTYLEI